ncbi:MAG: TolC family protein [Anaerolineaceae bacterium]|nr:TolC family protein [Anaerolineaceae bacterium]
MPALTEQSELSDYLVYAALNNPGLEAAFNRWKAALERVPQVRSLPDPRFTYRYFIREVETRVGPQQQSFELAQKFPWFGKLELRGGIALEAANAARQRYEAEKLKLFYLVQDAYFEYYYWSRAVAITRENRDLVKHFEQVAEMRYRAATGNHPDVIRAQVELGKLEDRLGTLLDLKGPIVARLNSLLNRPVEAPLPPAREMPGDELGASDAQVLLWLRESNPELKALAYEIAKEEQGIALARKEYFPDVTLGVNYVDTSEALMPGAPDSGKDPVVAMVSVNIPIWYEKLNAGVREARARHRAAARKKDDRANQLDAQAKLVLYKVRDAQRKIDLYGNALIPKARQSVQVDEAGYRAGKVGFLDLIDAERILLDFQLSFERATANSAQRTAELEMLVGRAIPRKKTTKETDSTPAKPTSDAKTEEREQ